MSTTSVEICQKKDMSKIRQKIERYDRRFVKRNQHNF